jgi:uncharacterized protein
MDLTDGAPAFDWLGVPGAPAACTWEDGVLTVAAGRMTDWFVDPSGVHAAGGNAPILLAPLGPTGDGSATGPARASLTATAAMDGTTQFDAAALYVFVNDRSWAKLALERNPLGQETLVSVVTDGTSDDCNHRVVAGPVRLRVCSVGGGAFAFHVEQDGRWDLLRLFGLGDAKAEPDSVRLGLSAQSPLGEGCTASFRGISWSADVPADLRDGS